jgi:PAS domain-containing protein
VALGGRCRLVPSHQPWRRKFLPSEVSHELAFENSMKTALDSRVLGSTVKLFIHGKALTSMQAGLRIASRGSPHVPGELHGSASDWASMDLFASIVNLCEDAIISMTIDGVVMSWNNSAERIFGYTAGEMVGQPIARLSRGDGETDLKQATGQAPER